MILFHHFSFTNLAYFIWLLLNCTCFHWMIFCLKVYLDFFTFLIRNPFVYYSQLIIDDGREIHLSEREIIHFSNYCNLFTLRIQLGVRIFCLSTEYIKMLINNQRAGFEKCSIIIFFTSEWMNMPRITEIEVQSAGRKTIVFIFGSVFFCPYLQQKRVMVQCKFIALNFFFTNKCLCLFSFEILLCSYLNANRAMA